MCIRVGSLALFLFQGGPPIRIVGTRKGDSIKPQQGPRALVDILTGTVLTRLHDEDFELVGDEVEHGLGVPAGSHFIYDLGYLIRNPRQRHRLWSINHVFTESPLHVSPAVLFGGILTPVASVIAAAVAVGVASEVRHTIVCEPVGPVRVRDSPFGGQVSQLH